MVLKGSRRVPEIWWDQSKEFRVETKKVTKAKRPILEKQTNVATKRLTKCDAPRDEQANQNVTLICDNREVCGSGKGKNIGLRLL